MELWTEYEGTTIDGAFPLTRLLQPEGRSALFSTSDGKGAAKILRLIESHFDDDEIIARWKGVAALNHPHLLRLEDYGKVTLDETALVYAVLEPADANLGEVLTNQRLTVAEARQLAESVASALEALHAHGFVHEHVEPASILAIGEVVKLRSDCIRETPEGEQGLVLKRQDVRDLSTVLLQALTQERTLEGAKRLLPLPAPFDQMVRKGLSGELSAAEILALVAPPPVRPESLPAGIPATERPEAVTAGALPVAAADVKPKSRETKPADPLQIPINFKASDEEPAVEWARIPWRAVMVVVLLLCVWLGWRILHRSGSGKANNPPAAAAGPVEAHASNSAAAVPVPAKPIAARPATSTNSDATHKQWRVIAYTYNREDQARHKSETVAQTHPELNPTVFSPTGHAPYLVTVGGVMSRDEAFALVGRVRREGLPRDSYAQNYKSE